MPAEDRAGEGEKARHPEGGQDDQGGLCQEERYRRGKEILISTFFSRAGKPIMSVNIMHLNFLDRIKNKCLCKSRKF